MNNKFNKMKQLTDLISKINTQLFYIVIINFYAKIKSFIAKLKTNLRYVYICLKLNLRVLQFDKKLVQNLYMFIAKIKSLTIRLKNNLYIIII